MSLRRSPSALGALHLFFKVDLVVFCEGGGVLAATDVYSGAGSDNTPDVMFWRGAIEKIGIGKTYHCKSVGNTTTLRSIASDVAAQGITTVMICRDRDYDVILGRLAPGSGICFTYGYSWESDVVAAPILGALCERFMGKGVPATVVASAIAASLGAFAISLVSAVEADIAQVAKQEEALFDRDKPGALLDFDAALPCVCPVRKKARLSKLGYRRGPRAVHRVPAQQVLNVGFGKMVSKMAYHVFIRAMRSHVTNFTLGYSQFMRMAISEMFELFDDPALMAVSSHYAGQRTAF